jgi:hypothetical protein
MTLTNNDYFELASMIKEGYNTIEYTKDGEILFLECNCKVSGYREDDTNACITTNIEICVESAESYLEDSDKTDNNFNEYALDDMIRQFINY